MSPQHDETAELFGPEASPFLQWPGTFRCIVGCVGIGAILLAMAVLFRQTMVEHAGAVGFSWWSLVVLLSGFLGANVFGWICFFPDENRSIRQVVDNGFLIVVLLTSSLLLFGSVAASFQALGEIIPSDGRLAFGMFVWTGVTSAIWYARLRWGSKLSAEQSESYRASAGSFATYAMLALAYLLYRCFV